MRPIVLLLLFSAPSLCFACGPSQTNTKSVTAPPQQCKQLIRQISEIPVKEAGWESCQQDARYRDWNQSSDYLAWKKTSENWPKNSRTPPPPPPFPPESPFALGPMDPAHCKLLDPRAEGVDACLTDAISDTQLMKNPECLVFPTFVAVGDMAFDILSDRHPGLRARALPAHVDYYEYVRSPARRKKLQDRVKSLLPPLKKQM